MFAAPKSGSGKTLLTCAYLQALVKQQKKVSAFKCGPDYIDPMFHRQVFGIPSKNLDSFFAEGELLRKSFCEGTEQSEIAVLEGAMGLYDGLGGVEERGSAYEIAALTGTPIVLVVDARGMARSVIPLLKGFLSYDRERLIKGVILNRTSGMFYQSIKEQIEQELEIAVAGYFPVREDLQFESRHLGLVLPHEQRMIKEKIQAAAEQMRASVSLEILSGIADAAPGLDDWDAVPGLDEGHTSGTGCTDTYSAVSVGQSKPTHPVKIAVARDEAFCFYYEDNLRLLEEFGASLQFFSPLRDRKLPEGCCGLLLGGGYPELYAGQLSENASMRQSIRCAIEGGMPSLAECGGFLYLHEQLSDRGGMSYPMVGALRAEAFYRGKLVRFGYVELEGETECGLLAKGEHIRGHEFHYYDSTANGAGASATKPVTGRSWQCCHTGAAHLWGFPHLYYPSAPGFVRRFIREAEKRNK